jgi:hypothetical protein
MGFGPQRCAGVGFGRVAPDFSVQIVTHLDSLGRFGAKSRLDVRNAENLHRRS